MKKSESFHRISKEEAQTILEPYRADLEQCFREAWRLWEYERVNNADSFSMNGPSTRAMWLFDRIKATAKRCFSGREGITVSEKSMFRVTIADQLTIRFKKLNNQFKPSNIPTQQQLSYLYNLPLQGIPPTTYLTAGYILNKLATDIAGLYVVHQHGHDLLWTLELSSGIALPTTLELPLTIPAPVPARRVVSAKNMEVIEQQDKKVASE